MAPEHWRILLVDDDQLDRMAVRRALVSADSSIFLDEVELAKQVYERLRPPGDAYDCLMIDCYLPDESGVDLIRNLRAQGITTPILAVTGQNDESIEDALIAAGASDYMPKQDWRPDRLLRRLRYAIRVGRTEANYVEALALARRAVRDRDDLLSIVSHDLRNPLSAIGIAADLLIDPTLDPEERKVMVAAVQRSLHRAVRLIDDLLDVTRIEAGGLRLSRKDVSVRELLSQLQNEHALLAKDAGLELRIEVADGVDTMPVDRERILQVLGNLLSNAVRYARDSGEVLISARLDGHWVELAVADRGPGISPELLPHLFDRFFQASHQKSAGAGLGLAIAKGLVEAHGGSITATSTLGNGTRFILTLPRVI